MKVTLVKDQLVRKIVTEFDLLRPYSYLVDDNNDNKNAKDTRRCAISENVNVKIIKVVLKQLNWKMKKNSKKIDLMWIFIQIIINI